MAEPLGTAELILTVNDTALRQGLADARKLIDSLQSDANRTRRPQNSTAGGTSSSSSGRRETKAERDLEVLKEKRFRLARRIDSLEERGVSTTRLRTQLGRLTTAYADREFTTARRISQELARQVTLSEAKDRTARRTAREAKAQADANVRSARGLGRVNIDGSQRDVGSPVFSARGVSRGGARESTNALTDAQKRRYKLDQQIRSLEANGVKTTKLRTQLGEATTAQARRQFGSFNQIADSLEFTLRKERDRLRVSRDQSREIERQARRGGPSEPLRGRVGLEGSPADNTFLARRGGPRLPINGLPSIADSPAGIRAENRLSAARDRSRKAAERLANAELREGRRVGRLNTSPVRGGPAFPGSPGEAEALAKAEQRLARDRERSRKAAESLANAEERKGRRIGSLNTSPVRGGIAFPGSPAAIEAAVRAEKVLQREREKTANATIQAFRKESSVRSQKSGGSSRFKDALGSGIIGGAFPALFGQGAGASLGGGIGGVVGGLAGGQFGFGLSLVGTQIGQFVDDAINKTKTLVDAFKDPIASFDALKEASLLSSKGLETNIASLIKAGREEEAAALIRGDLNKSFGNGQEFKQLGIAYDGVSRNLTKLGVSLVDGLAPALIVGANAVATFIDKLSGLKVKAAGNDIQQAKQFIGNDPSRQAEFDALFKNNGGKYGGSGKFTFDSIGAATKASRELLNNNKQLTREQQLQAEEANAYSAAAGRTVALRKLERQLILESNSGNRLNTLEYERQKLLFERTRALNLAPAGDTVAADKIRSDFAEKLLKNEQDITKEKRSQLAADVASINRIAASKDLAAIARKSLSLSGTGVSALQATASYRDAIRAQQNAQAALRASPADPEAIRNLIEASAAVETASATARTQLVEAFRSAKREAQDAANALNDSYTSLLSLRTGNSGLGKYLNAQDKAQLENNTFQQLLPLFNAAKAQARQTLAAQGIQGFDYNISGPTADINKKIIDFINTVSADNKAQQQFGRTQESALFANNSLITATSQLATNNITLNDTLIQANAVIGALANKDWTVNVNVPGGSATGNVFSTVNSRS